MLGVAAAACSASSGDSSGDGGQAEGAIPVEYQAFAAAFDEERREARVPGAAVALIQNGQVTFAHGFGSKGPNSQASVDENTLFRIGSMTKALTATALLGLVQSGQISLDAALVSVIPDVAIGGSGDAGSDAGSDLAALTVREILSHQSGLYDYLVVDGPTDDSALSQFLTSSAFAASEYFMDPPGTFFNYTNPDYYLAGLALERVGGVPYRQAMSDRVLSPLGMTRTFFLPADVIADGDYSNGLSTAPDGGPLDVAPDSYDNAWARPAGYAFSSVVDYAKFVQFLYSGNASVLADSERLAMQSPQVSTLDIGGAQADVESYGFGLFIERGFSLEGGVYATTLIQHGGNIPGFSAHFSLVPSTGFGMVWFANADDIVLPKSTSFALFHFAGLPSPTTSIPPGVEPDPSLFPAYAGSYEDLNGIGPVTVTANGATLSIDIPSFDVNGTPYVPVLVPATLDNFVLTVNGEPINLTFIADSTGAYVWIRTRITVAHRIAIDGG